MPIDKLLAQYNTVIELLTAVIDAATDLQEIDDLRGGDDVAKSIRQLATDRRRALIMRRAQLLTK